MARTKRGETTALQLRISEKAYQEIQNLAASIQEGKTNTYNVSDLIREAIELYFQKRGIEIELKVNRGSYRRKRNKQGNQ